MAIKRKVAFRLNARSTALELLIVQLSIDSLFISINCINSSQGKSVRRRAASMETSKYEKRRGRVKKQAENLKNGGLTSTYRILTCN